MMVSTKAGALGALRVMIDLPEHQAEGYILSKLLPASGYTDSVKISLGRAFYHVGEKSLSNFILQSTDNLQQKIAQFLRDRRARKGQGATG